ncbi:unnamed protein product [Closterium sp. NIES-64]|nr:unnamed protein product [Closterium sp. NIES-64]
MGALRSLFLLALVLAATLSLAGVSAAPRRALGKVKGDPPQKPLPPTPFDPKSFPVASNPSSPSGSRKGSMDSTISFDSKAPSVPSLGGSPSRKGSADSSFSFDSKDGGSRRSSVDSVSSVKATAVKARRALLDFAGQRNVPEATGPQTPKPAEVDGADSHVATPRILVIKGGPQKPLPPNPSGSRKGSMDSTISFNSKAPSVPSLNGAPSRKGSADSTFSFDSKDGGSRRSSVGSVSSVDSAAAAKQFLANVPNAFEPYSGNSGGSRKGSGATPRILVIKGGPQKPLPPSPSGSRKGSMDSTISFNSKAPSVPSLNGAPSRKGSADSTFSFDSKDGGSRRSSVGSVSSVDSAAAAKQFLANVPNAFEPYSGNSGGSRKGSGATPRILVIKGGPQKPLPPNPSGSRKGSMDSTISFDSKAPSVPSLNGAPSRKDSEAPNRLEGMGSGAVFLWY